MAAQTHRVASRGGSETRPYQILAWGMIAAGLALRLAIAPLGAHPGDLATLTRWAEALGDHGWLAIYAVSDANYPPLALAILAGSRWVAEVLGGGDPRAAPTLWWVALKLPAILADGGIALLVWRLAGDRHGRLWLVASVAFNPALVYLSAWWGQYESLYALAALGALIAAGEGRPLWAGAALGLGAMVKLQAAVIAPVVVMVIAVGARHALPLQNRLGRFGVGLVLPLALMLGPFVATGQGGLVARRLAALVAAPGWLTVNALNVWYLLTRGAGNWAYNVPLAWPDTAPLLGGLSARALGSAATVVWALGVLALFWRARARKGAALLAGALLYLGIFLWPTQAHERYAFGAVVMMAGAAALSLHPGANRAGSRCGASLLYGFVTLAHTLNLVWAAPFASELEGWFAGGQAAGMAIAAAMLAAAAWGWVTLFLSPESSPQKGPE